MAQGTSTITALDGTVAAVTEGYSITGFEITGTWVATITIEATLDDTNWFVISGVNPNNAAIVNTFSANTQIGVHCGGYSQVRLRASAFTSGTITVAWNNGDGNDLITIASWLGSSTPTVGQKVMASSLPITVASDQSAIPVSIGNTTGKTNVLKTASLVTTAVTADQVVLTYTVTAAKTFYLEYLGVSCGLTTAPVNYNTPVVFGTVSLETPSGTKDITWRFMGPQMIWHNYEFVEPIPVAAGVVIRVVCTPGVTTSLTWNANFGGYER